MGIIDEIAEGQGRTLRQIAAILPSNRQGKEVTTSAVLRWVLKGAIAAGGGRIRLEARRCGNKWVSSLPALRRFLAGQAGTPTDTDAEDRSPAAASAASERADEALEALGIS